ncbi:MAG TPA: hypothetical protein VG939_00150 [Caulobacteraceae bacterium]|nr:hypothetical protein [Caulobacteraceae bacterium]
MSATLKSRAAFQAGHQPDQEAAPTVTAAQVLGAVAMFHVILFFAILMFVGMSSRFVPTRLGQALVYGGAVALALALPGCLLWRRLASRPPGGSPIRRTAGQVWASRLLAFLLGGIGIVVPGSAILGLFACWYTDLAGSPGVRVVTVTGHSGGPHVCSQFDVAEVDPLDGAFCASPAFLHRHPAGARLRLAGTTSPLGTDIAPVEDTNP